MNTPPAISLIIPAWNCARFLPECLQSIHAQTFRDFEIIVVDDGSTDDTPRILEEAQTEYDRFTIISQQNQGPGQARNAGLAAAVGDYVLFIDSDDLIDAHLLERAYQKAQDTGADIVIFKMRILNMEDGLHHPLADQWKQEDFAECFAPALYADTLLPAFKNWPPDKLFKRSFLMQQHLAFPPLYRTEDLPFTCEALVLAQSIALLDQELYTYRVENPESSTQSIDRAPMDFYRSACLFHDFLAEHGLMDTYKVSYRNWIALCCTVNLLNLKTPEAFVDVYETLHEGGLALLDLDDLQSDQLADPDVYRIIEIIRRHDAAHGTFLIWQHESARQAARHDEEMATVMESTTFKVGSALTKPFTKMKDLKNQHPAS